MRPLRRIRTGERRDGGVRRIRAEEVRYPGSDLSHLTADAGTRNSSGTGLRPARDTGLAVRGRAAREHHRRAQAQRRIALWVIVAIGLVVVVASGWKYSSDRTADLQTGPAGQGSNAPRRSGTVPESATGVGLSAVNGQSGPTPYFASYKGLKLRLPTSAADVTEVGFHQASYSYALHMKSLVPYGDAEKAKEDRTTHRDLKTQGVEANSVLTGEVLKLWRNRPGKPDTAVDVGANAGATVYSPVTGTVVKVKQFDLYGKYPDMEVHIQPTGYPTLDVVMIHIDGVICAPGDKVVGGTTPIAQIRDLDPRIGPQLKSYTTNGGTHTHVQVNDSTYPGYKGLKGAFKVDQL